MLSLKRLILLAGASIVSAQRTFDKANVTLAAVVAAPAGWPLPVGNKNWDGHHYSLNRTVAFAVDLIHEARQNGADLIAFPELWFPGYPKSYEPKWLIPNVEEYVAESMEVGSAEWKVLLDAARDAEIFLSFGYSERDGDFIYMSQALIGPTGEVLINRRKLRPSGSERGLWSDGTLDGLTVVDTSIGRIGMLECWEHLRPSMTFNVRVQSENIHIGAWPYNQNPGADVQPFEEADVAISALRVHSIASGSIAVSPSIGYGFINDYTTFLAESDSTHVASPGRREGDPIIYASVNGSSWTDQAYDINGEHSWATLQQIEEGFPRGIPRDNGTFVSFRQYSTSQIIANMRAGNATEELPPSTSVTTTPTTSVIMAPSTPSVPQSTGSTFTGSYLLMVVVMMVFFVIL